MTKSIKQLREQLELLQQKVRDLSGELEQSYGQYFQYLGDSVGKQLVLASYQICTQKYPESFLKLTLNNRHELQQKMKSFKSLFNRELATYILNINYYNQEILNKFSQIILKNEPELEVEKLIEDHSKITNNEPENNLNPDSLIQFHQQIDYGIEQILQNISQMANRYLQQESILPKQLPPKILDMALQAEESASMTSSAPNLLSLIIEKEQDREAEERDITSITAICMRLSEIEFADPNLGVHRNQIRSILLKIEQTREKYHHIQKQYAMAEAEAAWRSSWSED